MGGWGAQYPLVTLSAMLGGLVRVGLEDDFDLGKAKLAKSIAQALAQIRNSLVKLSLDIATPDEARAMLGARVVASVKIKPISGSAGRPELRRLTGRS